MAVTQPEYTMTLGAPGGDHFALRVGAAHPDEPEPYRWVPVEAICRFGAFAGGFSASLLADEIRRLSDDMARLAHVLDGELVFDATEEQVRFSLAVQPTGRVSFAGELCDAAGAGNRLSFATELDQTHLASASAALARIVRDRL